MKKTKKLVIVFCIIIIILILAVFIWWYYPVTRIDLNQLMPNERVAYIQGRTDSAHPLRDAGIQLVAEKAGRQLTGWKRSMVRLGLSYVFPEEIRLVFPKHLPAIGKSEESKPATEFVVLIDFGRGIKLVRLFKNSLTKQLFAGVPLQEQQVGQYTIQYNSTGINKSGFTLRACAWIDSGLILSSDLNQLKEQLANYRSGAPQINQAAPDLEFFINNKNQELTNRIRPLEEKLEYAIFPTISAVESVQGTLTLQDVNQGAGKMLFQMTRTLPNDTWKQIESDIAFFKNVLRRAANAQDITMNASISTQGDTVTMDYQLTGWKKLLTKLVSP